MPHTHDHPHHRYVTPRAVLRRRASLSVLALSAALLLGCATPSPGDYAAEKPTLQLRDYLNGPLLAHGLFTDRSGRVVKRFTVELVGRWQGASGVLEEDFKYSDGTTQRRVWRLQDLGNGRYSGEADDVVPLSAVLDWARPQLLPVTVVPATGHFFHGQLPLLKQLVTRSL